MGVKPFSGTQMTLEGSTSGSVAKDEVTGEVSVSMASTDELVKRVPRELISQLNSTTGKMEWNEVPDDYDYHLEIARSAFADMLHDHDRNMRYYKALRYEISILKSKGEVVNVLDIGTGTGLLSMMAVEAGADNVYACDAFTPMLECARKVVRRNGFEGRIKLIPKRSTELVVGVDLPCRCNLLVTEVFDTELIGEWAVSTFNHAHEVLLTDNPVVIPATSTVYAQVVNCDEVEKWNSLPPTLQITPDLSIRFPPEVSQCPGVPSCQDLQLDAIGRDEFTVLSPPIPVFKFDFTSKEPLSKKRECANKFKTEAGGKANAVFMWWDLEMDRSGGNVLSCQPGYVGDGPERWFGDGVVKGKGEWRDHWMHSVYYVPRREELGGEGVLYSSHDEYSFWFDVREGGGGGGSSAHPVCECGVHAVLSRYQVRMINDVGRFRRVVEGLKGVVTNDSVCVCLSDCSVMPVILARMGVKKVFAVENCNGNGEVTRRVVEENGVGGVVSVVVRGDEDEFLSGDFCGVKIDVVVGDPYFHGSTYPWNNLRFWYLSKSLPVELVGDCRVAPCKAVLRGVACNFTHLWKICAPVGVAAGEFDLVDFDRLIENSMAIADSPVDAQPLWEYESTATSSPVTFMEFDLTSDCLQKSQTRGKISTSGTTNGIAIWVDWELSDTVSLSTGPKSTIIPGSPITWERHCKQAVYFVNSSSDIEYEISFDNGTFDFKFF